MQSPFIRDVGSGRCSKSNKLLKSIQNRIKNETLLAECRALGIIGKLICGPLWRIFIILTAR
jgi:hypothetical protein